MNFQEIKTVVLDQRSHGDLGASIIPREEAQHFDEWLAHPEMVILMGVRRCGKSTLLQMLREKAPERDFYINFEDDRLSRFTSDDFQTLLDVWVTLYGSQSIFYFDEIQNIEGWEHFVRRLYDQGYKIFITGSNARLFSQELGTKLTGRTIGIEVFPLSFKERCEGSHPQWVSHLDRLDTKSQQILSHQFHQYVETGGFPSYVFHGQLAYLQSLFEGLLYRDVMVRYRLTHASEIRSLVVWLASHCGKTMTFSALKKNIGVGSLTTVRDYCTYLELTYLCFFVNRYAYSLKAQQLAPKKVYWIDHALARTIGFRFSEDRGRLLENIVFLELKRRGYQIYYHQREHECDFVITQGLTVTQAIQVSVHLDDPDTRQREIEGLHEAMIDHNLECGLILTEHGEENLILKGEQEKTLSVKVMPVWHWLLCHSRENG